MVIICIIELFWLRHRRSKAKTKRSTKQKLNTESCSPEPQLFIGSEKQLIKCREYFPALLVRSCFLKKKKNPMHLHEKTTSVLNAKIIFFLSIDLFISSCCCSCCYFCNHLVTYCGGRRIHISHLVRNKIIFWWWIQRPRACLSKVPKSQLSNYNPLVLKSWSLHWEDTKETVAPEIGLKSFKTFAKEAPADRRLEEDQPGERDRK